MQKDEIKVLHHTDGDYIPKKDYVSVRDRVKELEKEIMFNNEYFGNVDDTVQQKIESAARLSYMKFQGRARGQAIVQADAYEYHLIGATMAYIKTQQDKERDQLKVEIENSNKLAQDQEDRIAEAEKIIKFYSVKKRVCHHDDPSWCDDRCEDGGFQAREYIAKRKK